MNRFLRLVAIASILAVCAFGCSSVKTEKTNPESMDELFKRYFGKSLEAFKNRKIYTGLKSEIIQNIPDEDLEQAIRDFIAIKIEHDFLRNCG